MRKGWGVGFLLTGKVLLTDTQYILKWWIRSQERIASSMKRGSQKKIQWALPILEGKPAASWHQGFFSISFQECSKSRGDSSHTLLITPCVWQPQHWNSNEWDWGFRKLGFGLSEYLCVWGGFWKLLSLYCYFTMYHKHLSHVHEWKCPTDREHCGWIKGLLVTRAIPKAKYQLTVIAHSCQGKQSQQ